MFKDILNVEVNILKPYSIVAFTSPNDSIFVFSDFMVRNFKKNNISIRTYAVVAHYVSYNMIFPIDIIFPILI